MKKQLLWSVCTLLLASASVVAQDEQKGTGQPDIKSEKALEKERKAAMKRQYFEEVFSSVSGKKTSSVILKNGETYRGFCKDVDTKKGQIYEIELKDSITGVKRTFKAGEISDVYLYPNQLEKILKMDSYFGKVNNWGNKSLKNITNKGLIHFKNQTVSLKNKKENKEYLMQLINPDFNSIFEVYGDPNAKETGGFGVAVGGIASPQFGGGVSKSYYVKKGDRIFWLHKSDFKENYNELFADNAAFIAKYPYEKIDWDNFSFLILEYTRMAESS